MFSSTPITFLEGIALGQIRDDLPNFCPRTGDVIAHVADGEAEDTNRAISAARKAFDEGPWPKMTPNVNTYPFLLCSNSKIVKNLASPFSLNMSRKNHVYFCALLICLKGAILKLQLLKHGIVGSLMNR